MVQDAKLIRPSHCFLNESSPLHDQASELRVVSHPVRFLLVHIIGLTDGELCLQYPGPTDLVLPDFRWIAEEAGSGPRERAQMTLKEASGYGRLMPVVRSRGL